MNPPVVGRHRRHRAQVRVEIQRIAEKREQIVRELPEHAAVGRFRAGDEPPPTLPAGERVEAGHRRLRADVVPPHRHINAAVVGHRRAVEHPTVLGRKFP
jgi:hypothetical protein